MKYTEIDKNLEKFFKKLYKKYPQNDAVRDYIRARYIYFYYMKIEYQHVHVEWDMARAFHEFNTNYLKEHLPKIDVEQLAKDWDEIYSAIYKKDNDIVSEIKNLLAENNIEAVPALWQAKSIKRIYFNSGNFGNAKVYIDCKTGNLEYTESSYQNDLAQEKIAELKKLENQIKEIVRA